MCHYAICPDGSTPVGSGTCVGFGVGECVHAADANGNCMGPTFCGGPSVNGFCPVTPPTNTSMTLPPLHCDQLGYVSCYDFGRGAGIVNGPQFDCPELSNANKSQTDNYCLGFKAGQAATGIIATVPGVLRTRNQSKCMSTYLLKIHHKYDELGKRTESVDKEEYLDFLEGLRSDIIYLLHRREINENQYKMLDDRIIEYLNKINNLR